jgi:Tfp pilus assembly protein PilE
MQTTQRSHNQGAGAQWAKHHFQRTGFTLLELAIMMAALVILITMVVTTFTQVQMHGRDKKRYGDISILHHELEDYYNTHGEYLAGAPTLKRPLFRHHAGLQRPQTLYFPVLMRARA